MTKTIEEIMKESDERIKIVLEQIEIILNNSRDRYYDALVYFGYVVRLIKYFGENDQVIFPASFEESLLDITKREKYRVDQTKNDDGSLILELVEIDKIE